MRMEENRKKKSTKGVGRKPKSDPAVHRYVVRLNSEENGRFNIQLEIRIERTFKIYQGDAFRTRNQGG